MDFKNIIGKVQNFKNIFEADDEDILDDATSGEDYEDSKKPGKAAKGIFDDSDDGFDSDFAAPSFSYSPTAALPKFDSVDDDFPAIKGFEEPAAATQVKSTSNLYDIKTAKPSSKYKLTFIALHDIYDARNVANLMMDKSSIVVVNISLLPDDQRKRAMDFLDGVKYVTKSVFARFTDTICAFLPADIELHGDFYNQVEL